jgi:hypothetical protein
MPKPRKDAESMSLNVRKFPIDLYWKCVRMADDERSEIGEFVIRKLREAVQVGMKPTKGRKTGND